MLDQVKDYKIVNISSNCGEDISCGWVNIGAYLCSKSSVNCPINSLKITQSNTLFGAEYFSRELDHEISLFFSKAKTDNFLVTTDFEISFGEVCADPLEMKVQHGMETGWSHWNVDFITNCQGFKFENAMGTNMMHDSRYKVVGNLNFKKLMQGNKLPEYMEAAGHESFVLDTKFDFEVQIFYRPYIGLNL